MDGKDALKKFSYTTFDNISVKENASCKKSCTFVTVAMMFTYRDEFDANDIEDFKRKYGHVPEVVDGEIQDYLQLAATMAEFMFDAVVDKVLGANFPIEVTCPGRIAGCCDEF